MKAYIVWSLKDGVLDPPREHEIPMEILAKVEEEFRREREREQMERMLA